MAGFQGTGHVVHYAASKAYVRVLAEGLWDELRDKGVHVLACCPGLVSSPTFLRGDPVRPRWLASPLMDCAPVVGQTLWALGRKPVIVPGTSNKVAACSRNTSCREDGIALPVGLHGRCTGIRSAKTYRDCPEAGPFRLGQLISMGGRGERPRDHVEHRRLGVTNAGHRTFVDHFRVENIMNHIRRRTAYIRCRQETRARPPPCRSDGQAPGLSARGFLPAVKIEPPTKSETTANPIAI